MIEEPKRSPASPFEQPSFGRESANANPPAAEPESAGVSSHAAYQDTTIKLSMRAELQSAFDGVYRIGDMIDRGQCSTTFLGTAIASTERVALKVLQVDPAVDPALPREE